MRHLVGGFFGTAAACLAVVVGGEHLSPAAPAGYERLRLEHQTLRVEADFLRRRVGLLEDALERDKLRRELMARPQTWMNSPGGADPVPADRIPAQTLPTTPKE